ncbi:4Fe-4S binding protein [Candidatus Babeliales bacterium]|nr:4Fe-4S binding protein [Candidatus Babeliales bacterium]
MPWIKQSECIGCGACINVCPVNAIYIKNNKAFINQEKCIHCGKCLTICPFEAIQHNCKNPDLKKAIHHNENKK